MADSPVIQDHYPADLAHCHGCGRLNADGLHLRSEWDGDEVVARFRPRPSHIALPGFVYGGLIASLVDCHAMATAAATAHRDAGGAPAAGEVPRFVTASLKVDYLRPTPLGPELVLRARVTETGRRKMQVGVSVVADGIETARGLVVAVLVPDSMVSSHPT